MSPRKGAARMADVTAETRAQLNAGTLESATIVEQFVIDFHQLLRVVVPSLPAERLNLVRPGDGILRRMSAAGQLLYSELGADVVEQLASHRSDTVRGWAAFALSHSPGLSLEARLMRARPLADDPHFGVREWVWLALRPHLAAELDPAIALLTPWTNEPSPFLRRFAVESTRPRGVWCAHIAALKLDPARGLPLLEPLRADPHRYVQDSLANWLNDAAKSQPAWVQTLCARWLEQSAMPATVRICARALRSITPLREHE
jgi:3-methyladenine DNA glycosylase AlkC